MALDPNDLFIVQSQDDNQLYSVRLADLDTYLESSSGIQFRGSVDLNDPPSAQSPQVNLPATNGDLYIVEADANPIDSGWVMHGGETEAKENDRIIFDWTSGGTWVLVSGGSSTGGTVTDVTASLPLKSSGDPVTPVITIRQARTDTKATTDGDGEGTAGAVAKLAETADVEHTSGSGDSTAVVTADLLKATNDAVQNLVVNAGGVQSVSTNDVDGNGALTILPTSGDVKIEINTSSETEYGVVQIATDTDIIAGVAGPSAVVDAAKLKDALADLPTTAMQDLTEGGTDIVSGALQIDNNADLEYTIGVNIKTFVSYDFSALTDITTT